MKKLLITACLLIGLTATSYADVIMVQGSPLVVLGNPVAVCFQNPVTLAGGTTSNSKVVGSNLVVNAATALIHDTHAFCPASITGDGSSATNTAFMGTLDLSGVTAGQTFTATNCAFSESEATIRATLGGGTFTDTDCVYEITSTAVADYNNLDFYPARDSALVDAGTDPGAGYELDLNGETRAGNGKPDAPTVTYPADEATKISILPTLTASTFAMTGATYDIGAEERIASTHTGSQWQIDQDGDTFASPLVDSGDDALNLESYAVITPLKRNTAYEWRVRYRTDAGWSPWTDAVAAADFTTKRASIFPFFFIINEDE